MSALSGAGMDDFFEAVKGATAEYKEFYLPDLERMQAVRSICAHKHSTLGAVPALTGLVLRCQCKGCGALC